MGVRGPRVAWRDMRRCILMLSMVFALGGLRAEVWTLQQWLAHGDSLRGLGQDAAALDAFSNAERAFKELGESCAVAQCAERMARIHIEWDNPVHADAALAVAMASGMACPELQGARTLWSLALGQLKLDLGDRQAAREWWMQVPLTVTDSSSLGLRMAAVEAQGRLAQMSLEEGDYERSESEHLEWAAGWLSVERRDEAAVALGWSGVCAALAQPDALPVVWSSLPTDPGGPRCRRMSACGTPSHGAAR